MKLKIVIPLNLRLDRESRGVLVYGIGHLDHKEKQISLNQPAQIQTKNEMKDRGSKQSEQWIIVKDYKGKMLNR
jgi:hypothetical protein